MLWVGWRREKEGWRERQCGGRARERKKRRKPALGGKCERERERGRGTEEKEGRLEGDKASKNEEFQGFCGSQKAKLMLFGLNLKPS